MTADAKATLVRLQGRERKRKFDARKRAERKRTMPGPSSAPLIAPDAVDSLAEWSRNTLIVPPGHPRSGEPLELPEYGVRFLREALAVPEALLSVARKNAKSAVIAVLLLAYLDGPLKFRGFRAGVCSINREKAGELWMQMEAIVEASGLTGVGCMRSPRHVKSESGRVDILSADAGAGHSSGFDLALMDELGLLKERDRELVNGLRTAVSARDGRFIGLSIQGNAPFTQEMLARSGAPGLVVHHYAAPEDCALDDEEAWAAANPGLAAGIKQINYMRHRAAAVLATPADAAAFRAYDLNQPVDPAQKNIVEAVEFRRCIVDDLPPRDGPCFVGLDLGGSKSFSGAAAYWPATHRLEAWGGVGGIPSLKDRGAADGLGNGYETQHERGELLLYPDWRETPCVPFFTDIANHLLGAQVAILAADRYTQGRMIDSLERADLPGWPSKVTWRGFGMKDGNEDTILFQRAVFGERIKTVRNLSLERAISESEMKYDEGGNQKLDKRRARGRIDCLSAAVLAVSMGERYGRERITTAPEGENPFDRRFGA